MYDLGSHFMVRGLTSVTPVLVACQTDVAFMRGASAVSDALTIYSTTLLHVKYAPESRTRACRHVHCVTPIFVRTIRETSFNNSCTNSH